MIKEKCDRDRFIEENLGLVHSVCKRFCDRGIEYDDLYQAGCVGLIKAFDAFDEERGFCFSTYAVPVIMGEIKRMFRDGGTVKVSRSIKELAFKIEINKRRLEQQLCREPTVTELSEAVGVGVEEVTEAICASRPVMSLSCGEEDGCEIDLPSPGVEDEISNRIYVTSAMEKLTEKEREIVFCRYFLSMTQSKTAEKMSMTQVQISRTEKRILQKLREILK